MAEVNGAIVAGRLTDLLAEEDQLDGVKDEIEQVVTELSRMMTFLPDVESRTRDFSVQDLLADVQKLAYDAEHVVNSFLVKTSPSPGKVMQWMNKWMFLRKIKDIQRKMSILSTRFHDYNIKSTSEPPEPGRRYSVVERQIFVGSQGDVDRLVGHLVNESDGCYPLITICGMAGLGKTTLAKKIYNHSTVQFYFPFSAWVSISPEWQTKLVLQRILTTLVHVKEEELLMMDDDNFILNLLQIQEKNKCLIVLDDICSTDAWDSLKTAFISENSLSKLVLTTRKFKVAEYVNPKGLIHQPEPLDAEQSWELLRLEAICSPNDLDTGDFKKMEEIGRKMVGNCGGVPLDIVIFGRILGPSPTLMEWEEFYRRSLSSLKLGKGFNRRYQYELSHIIHVNNDLPPRLKPYFRSTF